MPAIPPSVKGATDLDIYLEPFAFDLYKRQLNLQEWLDKFNANEGGLLGFASSYEKYGIHANPEDHSITYTEYIPNVHEVSLIGDFNNWDSSKHPLTDKGYGLWSITIPATSDGNYAIPHDSMLKVTMLLPGGDRIDRIPPWIMRATEPAAEGIHTYDGRFWNPEAADVYKFKYPRPQFPENSSIKIYEAHVGISTPEPKIGSYKNFTKNILPIIKKLGYNTIQLMAVMEHAYYASFGYQITNFFAASSRYGTPEDLKELIDTAHKLGIRVLLDIVHSHASKNVDDGLNLFNGTDHYLFHGGEKGNHSLWDSKLFNYNNYETLRFLLSNLKFWIDIYNFDGFRFDGVTSMIYKHHGNGVGFSGDYHEYFNESVDEEALTYLMLANELLVELGKREKFKFITIAEDVSGMPTLCLPINKGGIGFDYRLSMAVPDMWIKILKHLQDDEWDLGNIVHTLTNRRYGENCITYCESHDQALVGDKTLAFWLMDKEMYFNMSVLSPLTLVIDRGLALHKMIRLVTQSLGGEGYLNFEGNEFGHPEWLDFPREGNGSSYHYARRQFNLIEDEMLRYKFLFRFDCFLQHLDTAYNYLTAPQAYVSLKNEGDKVLIYERSGLLFILNFHHSNSYTDYKVGVDAGGCYKIVLNSDDEKFGGHGRVDNNTEFFTSPEGWNNRGNSLSCYLPSRTGLVMQLKEKIVPLVEEEF